MLTIIADMTHSLWNHRLDLYIAAVRGMERAILINRVFVCLLFMVATPTGLAIFSSPTIVPFVFIGALVVTAITFFGTVISYAFVRSARQHRANLSKIVFKYGVELEDSISAIMLYDRASNALIAEATFVR